MCAPDDLFLWAVENQIDMTPPPPHTHCILLIEASHKATHSQRKRKKDCPWSSAMKEGCVDDPNVHWKQSIKVP